MKGLYSTSVAAVSVRARLMAPLFYRALPWALVSALWLGLALWSVNAGSFGLHLGAIIAVYALAVVGVDLVAGRAGMLHVGYGVFFGIGAYTLGLAAQHWTLPTLPLVLVATVIAAVVAWAMGSLLAPLGGYLFALATLSTSAIFESLLRNLPGFGGTSGLGGISRDMVGTGALDGRAVFFLLLGLAAVVVALYSNLRRSRLGRAIEAMRLTPNVAQASGVDIAALRSQLFVLSGAIGGLSGALFALTVQYVSPDLFGVLASINFLVMNVVGGQSVAWGGLPGALLVRALPQAVQELRDYQLLVLGLVTALVVLAFRRGIAGSMEQLWDRLRDRIMPVVQAGAAATALTATDDDAAALSPASSGRRNGGDEAALRVEGLTVRFGGLVALDEVSLQVRSGQVVALIGPNGSGKTTLVNAIAGTVRPTSGRIWLDDEELTGMTPVERASKGIARTFQLVSLCQTLSALENVMLGAHAFAKAGIAQGLLPFLARREEEALQRSALEVMEALGIAHLAASRPSELSSGQARLVEVARCLMSRAKVILLDEPAAGLHAGERANLAQVIHRLARSGRGVLLIEHDMGFVMGLADSVVVLCDGRLLAQGSPREVRQDRRVIEAYLGEVVQL